MSFKSTRLRKTSAGPLDNGVIDKPDFFVFPTGVHLSFFLF